MKKIYLAGPMTGLPLQNWPLFFKVAKDLRGLGWDVLNPAEMDIINGDAPDRPPIDGNRQRILREDFKAIIDECDAIALLPDWRDSEGARAETWLSHLIGNVIYEIEFDEHGEPRHQVLLNLQESEVQTP